LYNYDKLCEWNQNFYSSQIDTFFENILADGKKIEYQKEMFIEHLLPEINWELEFLDMKCIEKVDISLGKDTLFIFTYLPKEVNTHLNDSKYAKKHTSNFLKKYFRYNGTFIFDESDLPF